MKRKLNWPDILTEFRELNPHDEVERLCCGPVWEQVKKGYVLPLAVETHHVFRAGSRAHLWCNLVRATSRAHHYFHRDHVGGIVVCMTAVLDRQADKTRVLDEWWQAFGKHPLWWLHGKITEEAVPEHYVEMAVGVLRAFEHPMPPDSGND